MGSPRFSTSSHESHTAFEPNSQQNSPDIGKLEDGLHSPTSSTRSSLKAKDKVHSHPSRRKSIRQAPSSEDTDSDFDYDEEVPMEPVEGWPKLTAMMAKTPDFAAFSRFRELNVKSLLYYQSQLTHLEKDLRRAEYRDSRPGQGERSAFSERIDLLMDNKRSKQFKLITKIREVLREYNEALLQYYQVSTLPEPDKYNMQNLEKWLCNKEGGDYKIGGDGEQYTWGLLEPKEDELTASTLWRQFTRLCWAFVLPTAAPLTGADKEDLDLVTPTPRSKVDGFTLWVLWYWFPFREDLREYWKRQWTDAQSEAEMGTPSKTDQKRVKDLPSTTDKERVKDPSKWVKPIPGFTNVKKLSGRTALRITSGISTVIACLLPVVAIVVLSQVKGLRNLLLCLAGFAVIFCVGLLFLTNGTSSRVEIFTATAAFSAVLVVFISEPVVVVTSSAGTT